MAVPDFQSLMLPDERRRLSVALATIQVGFPKSDRRGAWIGANALMGPLASTLAAISCGAVFMGANSYIGNAPNFMVKAVVEETGTRMPSFLGYMAWSGAILLPLFGLLTVLFFM